MKKWSIAACIMLFLTGSIGSAQEKEKLNDIRTLLEVTGAANLAMQVMNQLITSFKASSPEVPDSFWDKFIREVNPRDLVDLVVPIYDKYFTQQEIKDLLAFYKTPLGEKTITVTPLLMRESMAAGQLWGEKIGQRVILKLKEKGYKKDL